MIERIVNRTSGACDVRETHTSKAAVLRARVTPGSGRVGVKWPRPCVFCTMRSAVEASNSYSLSMLPPLRLTDDVPVKDLVSVGSDEALDKRYDQKRLLANGGSRFIRFRSPVPE